MNNKGITLVEIIVGIALASIVIGGAASIQVLTTKVVVERRITTDQRHVVEMVKDDIMQTLTYVEAVELSNTETTNIKGAHFLSYDEQEGYTKDGEPVFGQTVYNGNKLDLSFQIGSNSNILCHMNIWEPGGIKLSDTFAIRLLNVESKEIQPQDTTSTYRYIHYSNEPNKSKSMP